MSLFIYIGGLGIIGNISGVTDFGGDDTGGIPSLSNDRGGDCGGDRGGDCATTGTTACEDIGKTTLKDGIDDELDVCSYGVGIIGSNCPCFDILLNWDDDIEMADDGLGDKGFTTVIFVIIGTCGPDGTGNMAGALVRGEVGVGISNGGGALILGRTASTERGCL